MIAAGAAQDAVLRLLWTAGREDAHRPVGLALVSALPRGLDGSTPAGCGSPPCPGRRGRSAGAKSTSYAENLAARDSAARREADDALLVAADGTVLEAPTANVWWREHDRLLTPALDLPILAGVTRGALARARAGGRLHGRGGLVPAGPARCRRRGLRVSSSIREVMPVVAVDGRPAGPGIPGPAAAALQRALREAAGAGYPLGQ